jgi:hypothetical protein
VIIVKAIELSACQKNILDEITPCRLLPHSLIQSATIMLQAAEGNKNKVISKNLQKRASGTR